MGVRAGTAIGGAYSTATSRKDARPGEWQSLLEEVLVELVSVQEAHGGGIFGSLDVLLATAVAKCVAILPAATVTVGAAQDSNPVPVGT